MRKGKDPEPDPYIWLMDPDPGGPKIRIPKTAWRGGSSPGRGRQSAGWTARGRGPRTPPCRHPAQPSSSLGGPPGQTVEPRVGRKNSFTFYTKIQCCGSMTFWYGSESADLFLTNGFGSCYFRHWPSRCQQQKTNFFLIFSSYFFLKVHWHHFSKIKSKRSHKTLRITVLLTIFASL